MIKWNVYIKGIFENCSIPVWISFFCWTQKKKLWRMWVTEQLTDPI